ncbi:MAG TPA: cytochrome c [Kofleriaceae bacterium]|jgi:cytochrome c553|nr:cytochrome c [Kofleriaceae bacterium]
MRRILCVAVLSLSAIACGKGDKPPAPSSGAPNAPAETGPGGGGGGGAPSAPAGDPAAEAKQVFATVCAACHGPSGAGDGPASASLTPRPRNYTDAAWQASVTDDDIKKIILEGGQAVGKSPAMPAQQQLKDKPAVVDELVKLIRSFGPK